MAPACAQNAAALPSFPKATAELPGKVLHLPKALAPDRIYREAAPMLRGFAKRLGAPACEVDDIVHAAFLRLLEAGPFPTIEAARCYLCAAVRCILIDRHRRAAFRKTECAGDDLATMATPDRTLWESDREHEQALAALSAAVDELARCPSPPPGARELAWFYRDGLSLKEICARTGEPVGTVSARLTRARSRYAPLLRQAAEAAL